MTTPYEIPCPWYAENGEHDETIVSTRVRLARNLASFPFPERFQGDDAKRARALIFDAFSRIGDTGSYHALKHSALDQGTRCILEERGIIRSAKDFAQNQEKSQCGIVMSADGRISCEVNCRDHLHLASFSTGLSVRSAYKACATVDAALQNELPFAASYDFGYLTSQFEDCGSGMKLSARIHIPATERSGKMPYLRDFLSKNALGLHYLFPPQFVDSPSAYFYTIYTCSAIDGSEIDRIAAFEAACKYIAEKERIFSANIADRKSVVHRNFVIRAYSTAKTSLLLPLSESLDVIADLKFGLKLGLLTGISDSALGGLLFRVQPGHLAFVMSAGKFVFEDDIASSALLKLDRLRALIIQEALTNATLRNI